MKRKNEKYHQLSGNQFDLPSLPSPPSLSTLSVLSLSFSVSLTLGRVWSVTLLSVPVANADEKCWDVAPPLGSFLSLLFCSSPSEWMTPLATRKVEKEKAGVGGERGNGLPCVAHRLPWNHGSSRRHLRVFFVSSSNYEQLIRSLAFVRKKISSIFFLPMAHLYVRQAHG